MKISFILLFCVFLHISAADGFAQRTRKSMAATNVSIEQILNQIERNSDYTFLFSDKTVNIAKIVSVKTRSKDIHVILDELFAGSNIIYRIEGKQILLKSAPRLVAVQGVQQQKKTVNVRGTVKDANGEAIIGASVVEVGSTGNGIITDMNGRFQLDVKPGCELQISYIGYKPTIIRMKTGSNSVNVVLQEDTKALEEVVVVGYGTMKKRDLTGSISSVKGDELALAGVSSVAHALSGKAAGLYVRQNSAQPGGGLDILIRGAGSVNASNAPLYIVDGFPIAKLDQDKGTNSRMDPGTQGVLNFLNPNDVESIEVLKDASATAIYGARAANGVVIITTKRGKAGKTKVNYSYNYSYQKYSDKYDLLSLKEWMQEKNNSSWEKWIWENKVAPWGTKTLEEAIASPVNGLAYSRPYTDSEISNAGEGTDWLGLITRNGQVQEHNLSIQGGSEDTQYMVSFNYYNNEGIIRNSGMTRYTVKSNIDQKFLNIFKMGVNLTLTRIDNDNTQLGSEKYEKSGIIRSAIQMGPNIKAYDEATGTYPVNPLLGTQPNPYSLLNNQDKGTTDRLLGNVYLEAYPIKGLTLRLNAGIDKAEMKRRTYEPKTTLYGSKLNGKGNIYNTDNNQYLMEATANYQTTIGLIHHINLLAGASYEQFNYETSSLGNNNFLTDGFSYNNLGAGTGTKEVASGLSKNKMESYFFRANYILKDRYMITATLRADGASVFAKNHKWGYFPSVALGWTMSEEKFLKKYDWLSMLKLRASWGQTGNSDIGTNAFASYYAQAAYNAEDKSQIIGVFQGKLENPDLKWETTTEWNLGLDFGFLNNRILGTVEYYHKVISDLLNYKDLNSYQTITQVMANIGKTQSNGIEVTLNTKNILTRDFTWSTDFTFTKYKDKWKERTPDWKPSVYERDNDPIRPIYSRIADHIMQIGEATPAAQPLLVPGQMVIKDLNGYVRDADNNLVTDNNGRFLLTGAPDGKIDDADDVLIGSQDPGWLAGMTNTFRYKNFDMSFQLSGMFDRRMEDPTELEYGITAGNIADYGYNALRTVKKRWTWDNPSTKYPSSFNGWDNDYSTGDWYYQKAWFVRLQNVTLGYTLPKQWLLKTKVISNVRIHASANNLFVITPYKGLDPETDYYTAAYPNARTYTIGIDVTF